LPLGHARGGKYLKVGVFRRPCGEFGIERERLFEHLKRLLRFSRPRQEAREVERAIPDLGSKATASLPMARARAYSFASTNRYASEVSARTLPNSEDAPQLLNGLFVVVHAQVAYRSVPA
jgi:hypothetical protein